MAIDTSTPNGRLMLSILGSHAQFEREIMLERQREGIAKAKAEGMRLIKVLAENWCRNRCYTHVKTTLAPRWPLKFKT
jgi:DNA invertase Pin-like site-specific DNA recombinase